MPAKFCRRQTPIARFAGYSLRVFSPASPMERERSVDDAESPRRRTPRFVMGSYLESMMTYELDGPEAVTTSKFQAMRRFIDSPSMSKQWPRCEMIVHVITTSAA